MRKFNLTNILISLFITFFISTPLIPLASADWPVYQFNPQHDGTDSSETGIANPLTVQWQQNQLASANIVEA